MPGIAIELPDEDEAYERLRDREERRAAEDAWHAETLLRQQQQTEEKQQ